MNSRDGVHDHERAARAEQPEKQDRRRTPERHAERHPVRRRLGADDFLAAQSMNLGRAGRRMHGACGRIGEENRRRDNHTRSVQLEANLQIPARQEVMRDEGARSGREHHSRDEYPDPSR